ncbi:MAG: T9SS type A sorting domain-containing protein [Rhodothermales bacterium]
MSLKKTQSTVRWFFQPALLTFCLSMLLPAQVFAQGKTSTYETSTQTLSLQELKARLPERVLAKFDTPQHPNRLTTSESQTARNAARASAVADEILLNRIYDRLTRKASFYEDASVAKQKFVKGNEQDSLVLVQLFNNTDGNMWTTNTGWLTGALSTWHGISLDEEGYVIEVSLPGNQLAGTIPGDITALVDLRVLNLTDNLLAGSIPPAIDQLTELQILDLSFNFLEGTIPSSITEMPSLTKLILWGNQLTGAIPFSIGDMIQLEELWLFQNQLSGAIPSSLGNLQNLTRLYLDVNNFTGSIPENIAEMANLEELFLDFNELTGTVPAEFAGLQNLVVLYAGDNPLGGTFPEALTSMSALRVLSIANAEMTGTIPASIDGLTSLSQLHLNGNQLEGGIPETINNLSNLTQLNLANNLLSGRIPSDFNSNSPNLVRLWLNNNMFSGDIPGTLGFLPLLQTLDLSVNQLSGPIPPFPSNESLRFLYVNDNQLSGSVSGQFDASPLLTELDLSNNFLSGDLPRTMGGFLIMEELYLAGNEFTGALPESMSNLQALSILNLFNNQFSGEIPSLLAELPELFVLDLGANQFTGSVPAGIGQLPELAFLLLDFNNLTSELPASFSSANNLFGITVVDNQITGVPDLSTVPFLSIVELQDNRLDFGDIEPLLGLTLNNLTYNPQKEVYPIIDDLGTSVRYSVDLDGTSNLYQWYRNNIAIAGATSATLELENTGNQTAMDTILVDVTSNVVQGLVLSSVPARTDAVLSEASIFPDNPTLSAGDVLQFAALGLDQFGSARLFTTAWTSTGGAIDANGVFTAGDLNGTFEVSAADLSGFITATTTLTIENGSGSTSIEETIPGETSYVLQQNYPNPFFSRTQLSVQLSKATFVQLKVFDLLGREMATVADRVLPAGSHVFPVSTEAWPAGVYFYTLEAGNTTSTRSMVKTR